MRIRSVVLLAIALALAACGSKDSYDRVLDDAAGFRDRMCACTDKACAARVQDAWREYRKTLRDKLEKGTKPTEAQEQQGRAIDDAMRECRRKWDAAAGSAAGASAPSP